MGTGTIVVWCMIFFVCLHHWADAIDPCTSYQNLTDRTRSVNFVPANAGNVVLNCDFLLPQKWYAFTAGTNGPYQVMPTKCVPEYHCGTHVPFWMDGTLPSVGDKIVTRTSYGTNGNDCHFTSVSIRVKNCNGFYVYELPGLNGCSMGYCAGDRVPCAKHETSPTGYQPCHPKYPDMQNGPTLSYPIREQYTFKFGCHVNYDLARTDAGFEVTWLFDGKPDFSGNVPRKTLTGIQRDAFLDQKFLKGHFGQELSCAVKAYNMSTPHNKGPSFVSNNYWMGIKLSRNNITVEENKEESVKVSLITTVPIVCDKTHQRGCQLQILLDPHSSHLANAIPCALTLNQSHWSDSTHTGKVDFNVLARRDCQNDGDHLLFLNFHELNSVDVPMFFYNYSIPRLQIRTKDKDTSTCQCTGDPHCITFDAQAESGEKKSYTYLKTGEFVMAKSTVRPFEVQVQTWTCYKDKTCNCAVTAREGNDVITIDMCHTQYGQGFPKVRFPNKGQTTQGAIFFNNTDTGEYMITFPSGAWVKAVNYKGRSFDVSVHVPQDDFGHTVGLCGTFDGDRSNDLQHSDGHTIDPWTEFPNSFVDSWRVPAGTGMLRNPPTCNPAYNNNLTFCTCETAKRAMDCRTACKANTTSLCQGCYQTPLGPNGSKGASGSCMPAGRKRAGPTKGVDTDEPEPRPFNYFDFSTPTIPSWPTPSGTTHQGALRICQQAFRDNTAIAACENHAALDFGGHIEMCVMDILLTDTLEFVQSSVNAGIMSCIEVVLKNPKFNDASGQPPAFITTDLCPKSCSGKGVCHKGKCTCHYGYAGESCSIDVRIPPKLFGVIGRDLCDLDQRPCKTIYVSGDNMQKGNQFRCRLEEMEFKAGTFVSTGHVYMATADHMSNNHVGCHMPTPTQGNSIAAYNITVTNDKSLYSNVTKMVTIIDSRCLMCTDTQHCQIQPDTCVIKGNCYMPNEHNPTNSNQHCDPSRSEIEWTVLTEISPPSSNTELPETSVTTETPAMTTGKTAPLGGMEYERFDIWTLSQTGCPCKFDPARTDCACCDDDACQCYLGNHNQCVQCGHTQNCGTHLPGPTFGVDGYTLSLSGCRCFFDKARYDCACCQNGGCQCDLFQRNQCIKCGNDNKKCGNKPWIFGPRFD